MHTSRSSSAQTEDERIFATRMHNFLLLGFEESDADMLAASDVDWHEVERLVRLGCPPELAAQIVL